MIGIALFVFAGMATLGVDYARLALTANEAQIVADAAAEAGAFALWVGDVPEDAAMTVATANQMAGQRTDPGEVDIVVGTYNPVSNSFTQSNVNQNAVQATATKEVTNIFSGIIGDPKSTVQRIAVARIGPAISGQPTLPIAFSDCHFPPDCQDASCLPTLTQQPNPTDNSGFTGFDDNASTNVLLSFLPTECGGGGVEGPTLSVRDSISLSNGSHNAFLQALECTVCDEGQTDFVVPIISHCDENFTSASPPDTSSGNGTVFGFANITIDSFNYSNGGTGCGNVGGTPQSINLSAVVRDEGGSGSGGPCPGCQFEGVGLVL